MKRSGEIEPSSVFALLAGARCACTEAQAAPSLATAPHTAEIPTVLTSIEEARAAVDTAASTAQRVISIYTPDLEPELYDQSAFLEIIKRFVLSHSFSKVRVLLCGPAATCREGNRFAAMARRLSSYIEIRPVAPGPAQPATQAQRPSAYLIADDRAVVYRLRADRWDGIADFNNPAVARLYLCEFDELWSRSEPQDLPRSIRPRA